MENIREECEIVSFKNFESNNYDSFDMVIQEGKTRNQKKPLKISIKIHVKGVQETYLGRNKSVGDF